MGGSTMAEKKRRGAHQPAAALDALFADAVGVLLRGQRFLITTHRSPDADGIGSSLGLAGGLRALGKDVTLYSVDPVPRSFRTVPAARDFVAELPADARFDVSVVTDCCEVRRLGPHFPAAERRGTLVFLDHHLTRGDVADIDYNDDTSPAVGEIVVRFLRALDVPLTVEIAEPLYLSLLSDTGSFRYANTSPLAMRCGAELLEAGVDPWKMSSALFESQPVEKVRLLERVLGTLDLSRDGRTAVLSASKRMLAEVGASPEMLDGLVNYARSINGVEVAVLLFDVGDGSHKVSFRSRGSVNVAAVAARFGGGGHFHAAGCTVDGEVAAVRHRIYDAVEESLA